MLLAVWQVAFALAWPKRRPLERGGHLVDRTHPSCFCFRAAEMGLTWVSAVVAQMLFAVAQAEAIADADGREAALYEPGPFLLALGQLCGRA